MDKVVMVRGETYDAPNGASQAPTDFPIDLTNRSRDEPQDLRMRHKRERLEEMVNHIRQCSTVQKRKTDHSHQNELRARLNAPSGVKIEESDTESDDDEASWRPEDIFYLTNSQQSVVQDLSVRRSPSSPTSSASSSGEQRHLWTRVDAKTAFWHSAYLPWMTYYAHLVQAGKEIPGDDSTKPVALPTVASHSSASTVRKRGPRALTGKHVKPGTGASPSTLVTLRQKIEQRQKSRQKKNS